MKTTTNELGQQIGYSVKDYPPPSDPNFTKLEGATVVIEPIAGRIGYGNPEISVKIEELGIRK